MALRSGQHLWEVEYFSTAETSQLHFVPLISRWHPKIRPVFTDFREFDTKVHRKRHPFVRYWQKYGVDLDLWIRL